MGIPLPTLPAPIPHGVIGQDDAASGRELFNALAAEAEAAIQPDAVADYLRRNTMALVRVGYAWCVHAASMPREAGAGKRGVI